ncbi:MAG: hypothetical protein K2G94_05200, partial [Muribaculaceae bacterium]|nr:hypothetical protein [Muribaculaceae bacterium]
MSHLWMLVIGVRFLAKLLKNFFISKSAGYKNIRSGVWLAGVHSGCIVRSNRLTVYSAAGASAAGASAAGAAA